MNPTVPARRLLIAAAVVILLFHWMALAILLVGKGNVSTGLWALSRVSGLGAASQAPTPTPTKTPAPSTPTPTPPAKVAVQVHIPRTVPPSPSPTPTPTATPFPTPPPHVIEAARNAGFDLGARYIVVDQAAQRMYVVDGPRLLRSIPVSTGDPAQGTFTPPWVGRVGVYWGTFSARGVSADNAWHLFKTPAGNILIHGLPYVRDATGRKIYQDMDKVGRMPASRGCIRLYPEDAAWFTQWNPQGVPIVILPYKLRH